MKIQLTLITLFTSLYFNNVYAVSDDAYACNKAYEKGDLDTAAKLAAKALTASKNDRDALMCQGRTYSAQGNLTSALAAFKSAEKLANDAFDRTIVTLVTGHAYKNASQYEQALSSYQQSLKQANQHQAHHQPVQTLAVPHHQHHHGKHQGQGQAQGCLYFGL